MSRQADAHNITIASTTYNAFNARTGAALSASSGNRSMLIPLLCRGPAYMPTGASSSNASTSRYVVYRLRQTCLMGRPTPLQSIAPWEITAYVYVMRRGTGTRTLKSLRPRVWAACHAVIHLAVLVCVHATLPSLCAEGQVDAVLCINMWSPDLAGICSGDICGDFQRGFAYPRKFCCRVPP